MKIHELKDQDSRVFAFEVDNVLLSRRRVCRILRSIPGVRILKAPRFFSRSREAEFCEFELGGRRFKAWEPFGDNSRYWIGPEPAEWCEPVNLIREAFLRHPRK